MRNILFASLALVAACGYQSRRIADVEVPGGGVVAVAVADGASAEGEYVPDEAISDSEPDARPEIQPTCPITIERSPVDRDIRPSHPIAFGGQNWLIGEYIVRASCEDVDIIHVILHDRVGGEDTAADFFKNLRVFGGNEVPQHFVGAQVSELYDRFDQPYWFTPAIPIYVGARLATVFLNFVDVLDSPTGDADSVNGMAPFSVEVIAVGRESGERMKAELTDLPVVYLAQSGSLRVEARTTPLYDGSLHCGSRRDVANITLTAGRYEAVVVGVIRMKLVTNGDPRVLRNLYLVYGGSDYHVSDTVEEVDADGYANFRGMALPIGAGFSVGLTVHADVSAPHGEETQLFHFTMRGEDEGPLNPTIVAQGLDSGAFIMGAEMHYGSGEEDELVETTSLAVTCP